MLSRINSIRQLCVQSSSYIQTVGQLSHAVSLLRRIKILIHLSHIARGSVELLCAGEEVIVITHALTARQKRGFQRIATKSAKQLTHRICFYVPAGLNGT